MKARIPLGWLKLCFLLLNVSVCISNLISLISTDRDIFLNWYYWVPFFVLSFLSYYFPLNRLFFTACIVVGVFLSSATSDKSDLQGIIFFILALNILSSNKALITTLILTFISVVYRIFALNMTIPESILLIIAFYGSYVLFYTPQILRDNDGNK